MVSQIKNEFLNGNFNSTLLEISEARPAAITLIERENLNFDDQLPLTLTNGSVYIHICIIYISINN